MLDANWKTGKYIVEYELKGKDRAEYGKQLLVNLAKDLTTKNGKGFSRSNLVYMRKFYIAFPICETVSHKLTWSHYFELLKCENALDLCLNLQDFPNRNATRRMTWKRLWKTTWSNSFWKWVVALLLWADLSYAQTYLGHKQQELQTLWKSKTRITTSDIP